MPTVTQTIVTPEVITTQRTYGDRNSINMTKAFPQSPINGTSGLTADSGTYTDQEARDSYAEVLSSNTAGGGLGFNDFNRDYSTTTGDAAAGLKAPDLEGAEGVTAADAMGSPSPYAPNISSPGAGSIEDSDKPVYDGTLNGGSVAFGSGHGGLTSPKTTSDAIQGNDTTVLSLGQALELGRSYNGSTTL